MSEIRPDISVVILCYRAEDYVPVFVSRMKTALESLRAPFELVLVANYHKNANPPDKTPEIAKKVAAGDTRIVVVARPKEGMMGWDMRSGLAAASGETIAVIDGDGQMPPEDVLRVYRALKSGPYDMAKTYRRERKDGPMRITISRIYNFLLKLLFPSVKVRDANSKPKIFTRSALSRLNLEYDNWFIDAEIIIQASRLGFKIAEVPTVFYPNPTRPSFIRFKAVLEFIRDLIVYRFSGLW